MTGSPENPVTPLALPDQIADSGNLDRLVDTARGYADQAVSDEHDTPTGMPDTPEIPAPIALPTHVAGSSTRRGAMPITPSPRTPVGPKRATGPVSRAGAD